MHTIAQTPSHVLAVDPAKNRVYCTMTGQSLPEPAEFIRHWEQAARLVSAGFTAVVDVTRFRTASLKWMETAARAQAILFEAGLAILAEIVPAEVLCAIRCNGLSDDDDQLEKKIMFTNHNEAEAWLDNQFVAER